MLSLVRLFDPVVGPSLLPRTRLLRAFLRLSFLFVYPCVRGLAG